MDPKNYIIEQQQQHQHHRIIKTDDDEDVIDDEGLVVVEPSCERGGGAEINNRDKQWCDEALEDLINAYKPHECLWITSCEDYKDQDKKAIAFDLIDVKMRQHNFVRFEYTKKWAILRGQFLREVRRERCSSHKSGWRWYPKLEFLKSDEILFEKRVKSKTDTIMLSSPYNNTNNNNTNNNNNTKRKMIEPPHFPKRRHMLEVIAKPLYPPTMTKLPLQQTPKPPLQQQQQPPPIIHHDEGVRIEYITPSFIERKDDHRRPSLENTRHPTPPLQPSSTPLLASAPASANNHNHNNNHKPSTRIHTPPQQQQEHNSINNNTNNNSNNSDDQESLFGKMVASTLRKFTSYQRVVARKKIQDLLFEIELQNAADVDNNVK